MEKNETKKIGLFISIVVIGIIVWFLIVFPLIKFKRMESIMYKATKRYYEINESKLPSGNKIGKVTLDTLYKQDFINEDLKTPYTNKMCDSEKSWGIVKKKNDNYKYDVYLNCGIFKSRIDYKGPTIKLNGKETIKLYIGQKYKELGVSSVSDNTDGKIDIKKVKIDASGVDTSKVGIYEVKYIIKDSLQNETIKIRKVIVTQTINNVVKQNKNAYIMLDGILFEIVGVNDDGTVKIVSNEALVSLNHSGIDTWLNDYFYEKLSDSAKSLIYQNSKWCIDRISNPSKQKKCQKYSRKKKIGILSVEDYNNYKHINNSMAVWTSNSSKNNGNYYVNSYFDNNNGLEEFKETSEDEIHNIKPAINIVKNAVISSGDGSNTNPYILKGNENKTKIGDKISSVKTGSYIDYSGYLWRVIGSEDDKTTMIISINTISSEDGALTSIYGDDIDYYNPSIKNTLASNIINKASSYINTGYFVKKKMNINEYKDKVLYGKSTSTKAYSLKLREISLFDLYSPISEDYNNIWYQEISKNNKKVYVYSPSVGVYTENFDSTSEYSIRVVGYLDKDTVVKKGEGTYLNPYQIIK